MLRTLLRFARAFLALTLARDRPQRAWFVLTQMRWLQHNTLPVDYLVKLFPEVEGVVVPVTVDIAHPFELPYGERGIIAALAQALAPKVVFELGTFTGTTTKLLADASPGSVVHTLDLPSEEIRRRFAPWAWIADAIGAAFRDDARYRGRIVQHRADAAEFDFTPFLATCDLVFVDASHERADVLRDSRTALGLVSPGGVVVWDDFQPSVPGVVEALSELNRCGVQLVRIAHTRLVVHRPAGFPVVLTPHREPWAPAPAPGPLTPAAEPAGDAGTPDART